MAVFQMKDKSIQALQETNFSDEGLKERGDLQRLIQLNIQVISDDLMVITDEFADWADSSRRIDLLCIDSDANLVVIELKRTETGDHMELQALRYAAMVSAMRFEQMVEAHSRYLTKCSGNGDTAKASILQFLAWPDVKEEEFAQLTRIILASAGFGKELTTSVLWLRDQGVDIRCVRLKPYRTPEGQIFLDVQQLIPLPEASQYQTQLGSKKLAEREDRGERHELKYNFWSQLLALAKTKTDLHASRTPNDSGWISGSIGKSEFSLSYVTTKEKSRVELYISPGSGRREIKKKIFEALLLQKSEIESDFGGSLDWQELPETDSARICMNVEGGWRSPIEEWPNIQEKLVDAMIRLDRCFRKRVHKLKMQI